MNIYQSGVQIVYTDFPSTEVSSAGINVLYKDSSPAISQAGINVLHRNHTSEMSQVGVYLLQNMYPTRTPSNLSQAGIIITYDKTVTGYKVITVSGVQS